MAVLLTFSKPATTSPPIDLVFDEAAGLGVDRVLRISGTLPGLTISVELEAHTTMVVAGTLPGLTISVQLAYDLAVPSYIGTSPTLAWHDAEPDHKHSPVAIWGPAETIGSTTGQPWSPAARLTKPHGLPWRDNLAVNGRPSRLPWRGGETLVRIARLPWRDNLPVHGRSPRLAWRDGQVLDRFIGLPWREAGHLEVPFDLAWQQGRLNPGRTRLLWQQGLLKFGRTRLPWRDAMVLESHGGPIIIPDIPNPPDACYVPNAILEFNQLTPAATELLFICESDLQPPDTTIVVPVRRVYMVFNTFTLRNVETDTYIACTAFNMTLDVDSYTWSFSGSIPRAEFSKVQRSAPDVPVELEAVINGVAYRFLMDKIGGERQHGSFPSMRIQGRGLGAALDLLTGNYNNVIDRTAAQLMDDCLLVNGVGSDWTIDWQLTDWTVPAGAFAMQGTAVSALRSIVNAAGGYLQPDPVLKTLYALHRYPVPPWLWDAVVPDYELPTAVVTTEGMEWVDKPRWTRVFVAPSQGVITRVTREDASEILVAPTAVEAIAAEAVAGEQKGRTILSDTGRIVNTSLSLPVLEETGIIPPGKMIRYVEGLSEKLGITRAVSVSVTEGRTRQTLQVEIHE